MLNENIVRPSSNSFPHLSFIVDTPAAVTYKRRMFTAVPTARFADWIDGLRDRRAASKIAARIVRVEAGNFGDAKSVGDRVSELRVAYGPGYRVYFTRIGERVVILLCGGDKGSQARDIAVAKEMAAELHAAP